MTIDLKDVYFILACHPTTHPNVSLQIVKFLPSPIDRYAIPDTPYSIAANISTDELNTLVNTLLKETGFLKTVDFDFLVHGEFLR